MLTKKKFLISLFMLISAISYSQDYIPFPADSAFWKTDNHFEGEYETFVTYELDGDTVLNGIVYKRLFETRMTYVDVLDSFIFYSNHTFIGGIREQDKIVYYYHWYFAEENTIYNFNLGVGDTVFMWVVPIKILSIDTIQTLDGLSRRKYNVTDWGENTSWYIEGVGNEWGILTHYGYPDTPGPPTNLACFSDHGNLIYNDLDINIDCNPLTSVESLSSRKENLQVYPNPFTGQCFVDLGRPLLNAEMKITDALGNILIERKINENQIISGRELKGEGVYFLVVTTGGTIYTKKIIYNPGN